MRRRPRLSSIFKALAVTVGYVVVVPFALLLFTDKYAHGVGDSSYLRPVWVWVYVVVALAVLGYDLGRRIKTHGLRKSLADTVEGIASLFAAFFLGAWAIAVHDDHPTGKLWLLIGFSCSTALWGGARYVLARKGDKSCTTDSGLPTGSPPSAATPKDHGVGSSPTPTH